MYFIVSIVARNDVNRDIRAVIIECIENEVSKIKDSFGRELAGEIRGDIMRWEGYKPILFLSHFIVSGFIHL